LIDHNHHRRRRRRQLSDVVHKFQTTQETSDAISM